MSDLYRGTVLTELIDLVELVELSPEEQRAHPPNPRHWARCDFSWCRDCFDNWRKYGKRNADGGSEQLPVGSEDRSAASPSGSGDGVDLVGAENTPSGASEICGQCKTPFVMGRCWFCDVEARAV